MPPYVDLPYWGHNFDNVGVRLVNAGWNALFFQDLDDFSFIELSRDFGAAPQTLYYYFPSVKALGAELALRSVDTLLRDLGEGLADDIESTPEARRELSRLVFSRLLGFAAKRPRHYLLIFSPRYASPHEFPLLAQQRGALLENLKCLFEIEIRRLATDAEIHTLLSLLHGSASLVAAGHPAQTAHVLAAIYAFIDPLRDAAARAEPVAVPSPTEPSSTGAPEAGATSKTQPPEPELAESEATPHLADAAPEDDPPSG